MRKNRIIIAIVGFLIVSCQSKISTSNSESKYFTDSIYSNFLNEYRKHNVYLPKDFDSTKRYPIIYSTDGNEIKKNSFYQKTLDSLIERNIIKPTILIKSYSNQKIADSSGTLGNGDKMYLAYRYFEYLNQYSEGYNNSKIANRFKNHMQYFNDELISSVESKLNQKLTKEDRYFYGVSNGAGFGLHLLNSHPESIGTYLCFSTFGGDIQTNSWKSNVDYPKLYLEYGSEEPFFLKQDAEFLKTKYEELNLISEINEFDGGHDYKKWNEKFIQIISNELSVK
ncbi:alpha/beta hydrolase-fold protein [Winogradskyella sp. SYSU M77433]|uniref:alpha/beta hydrolase n=1 Tax=Winogradskyella sp. SYSU M77433 TaxID=3042722 RepID=UPI002480A08C|nr:alpha/beta hydrolase-fold protein [Winogradskyella sp. SYSU M77433]MDH7913999.1 alpha/beta hydrolase-fold protein [Winogradskyella sp. SYSU M77433]